MTHHTLLLNGLILGMLVVASLIGALLKWRVGFDTPHAVIDNLNARIKAWWVMAVVMSGTLAIGHWAVILLFAGISFFALREFLTIAPTRRGDHLALIAAFYLVLPLQYYLIAIGWYGLFSVFIPVYGFLLLPILATLGNDTQQFLTRASTVQWGLMVAVYCISCVPALMVLDIPDYRDSNSTCAASWPADTGLHRYSPPPRPWKVLWAGCCWPRAWAWLSAGSHPLPGGRPHSSPSLSTSWALRVAW